MRCDGLLASGCEAPAARLLAWVEEDDVLGHVLVALPVCERHERRWLESLTSTVELLRASVEQLELLRLNSRWEVVVPDAGGFIGPDDVEPGQGSP